MTNILKVLATSILHLESLIAQLSAYGVTGTSMPIQRGTLCPIQRGTLCPIQRGTLCPIQRGTLAYCHRQ